MITAIKPIYNYKSKAFWIHVVRDANVLMAHNGYLVFDDAAKTLDSVVDGKLIPSWTEVKRTAIITWLKEEITKPGEIHHASEELGCGRGDDLR